MYGRHFAALYEGSMVGSGAVVFAVWGYVIAKQVPDDEVGTQVRLNPKVIAAVLGEQEEDVVKAIQFLCAPDPNSTTKEKEGRRLVKLGEFDYQVVNGKKYREISNEADRRRQNRVAQAKARAKKRSKQCPSRAEMVFNDDVNKGKRTMDDTPIQDVQPSEETTAIDQ